MSQKHEIEKEAAKPFSQALISLKSIKDPFKEEVALVKELVVDAVNSLDYSLYLAATGEEKHTRAIAENLSSFKKTLRSVSAVISNNVAKKISSQMPNEPMQSGQERQSIEVPGPELPSSSAPAPASLVSSEEEKTGINSPEKLIKALNELQEKYKELELSAINLGNVLYTFFSNVLNKHKITIQIHREKTLSEIIREGYNSCNAISLDINNNPIETKRSSGLAPKDAIDEIVKSVNKNNFKESLESYNKLLRFYNHLNAKYMAVKNNYENAINVVDEIMKQNPPANPPESSAALNNKHTIIVLSDPYNKVLLNFIKKYAYEPSLFEKSHAFIGETLQDLVSPFSDPIKRRIKIRKSIKKIKKATVDLLVEIRKTAGKKESIEAEKNRWDSIINAYNYVAQEFSTQMNTTLSAQLSLSSADLYSKKITEMKGVSDQRGFDQQKHMSALMDAFQDPVPEMPKMNELIDLIKSGKPWGVKPQKLFP